MPTSMRAILKIALALVLAFLSVREATAAPRLEPTSVPDPLKPWTGWVLQGKEGALCPQLNGSTDQTRCAWPARLVLALDDHGGRFTQTWHVDAPSWVSLPGNEKRWPQDVKIGAKRAVVAPRSGAPSVFLEKGDFTITGVLLWDSLPESLQVPAETGLLSLSVRGSAVEQPTRDAKGTVWLHKAASAEEGERLEFVVHRKLTDDVPLALVTRIVLNVAGKNREVVLGKALPAGFIPTSLDSPLPSRLEPDTRLRIQVRPGTWTIELHSRSEGPTSDLKRPTPEGPWREGDEVWVFEARPTLRLSAVEGVSAIDPQQTTLPDSWRVFPAYPMRLSDTLKLVEKRRGDADPPPDHLSLVRTMWLDFDGRGYTASDVLTGTLSRASRLEMAPPTVLGRVAIGGKDQFITHLDDASRTGVEVRQGDLHVTADSRVTGNVGDVPAVGWNHDFYEVAGTLHLPPGWRLFHASGVDEVPGTWLKHWTLLEIFLALVLSLAVFRLYGALWGVVALVTFVLAFPEADSPKWVWISVLALEALTRVLPAGRVANAAGYARYLAIVVLALLAIPFLVQHVREGMYPALSRESMLDDGGGSFDGRMLGAKQADERPSAGSPESSTVNAPPAAATQAVPAAGDVPSEVEDGKEVIGNAKQRAPLNLGQSYQGSSKSQSRQFNAEVYDPNAMVQTGPGRPAWRWTDVPLKWSGPVERSQRLRLLLLSPPMNFILALVRAALIVALVLRTIPWNNLRKKVRLAGAVTGLALLMIPSAAHAEIPNKEVLKELEERLLAKPECAPNCASSSRAVIDAQKGTLRVRIEFDATSQTAVPLPGSAAQWAPSLVLLDGKPAKGLVRTTDGTLWLLLEAGSHQVAMEGTMSDRESIQLAFPLKPHRVSATTDGWTIEGLHEDGLVDENVQLTRVRSRETAAGSALQPGNLPPFVRVERTLLIALNWQVETRIVRVTPPGSAVVLEVPLLRGESVTTADVRIVSGKALVNMGPQVSEVSWRSVLDEKSPLVLSAPKTTSWIEMWRLDMSPVWHATLSGIAVVHPDKGVNVPSWRPWPGESVTIDVARPDGVPGQTLTLDSTHLVVRPGLRATDATLDVSLRSSRGAQHAMTLPEGAELESVSINGVTQPIRQEGRKVTLPLVPGTQKISLVWRDAAGIRAVYHAPTIDLGVPSVNTTTQIDVSDARWLLFLGGPRLGPAVLFWSLLLVLLVVAGLLGKIPWTPLATWQWMLLTVGLSQIPIAAAAIVVGWLVVLGWRKENAAATLSPVAFNARQLFVAFATLLALCILVVAVHQGLLGHPDMQIRGNGSSASSLRWYSDRSEAEPASPWIVSVPLLAYRGTMLAWALWLALSILQWLKWGWGAFSSGGLWKTRPRKVSVWAPPPDPPQGAPLPPEAGPAPPGAAGPKE